MSTYTPHIGVILLATFAIAQLYRAHYWKIRAIQKEKWIKDTYGESFNVGTFYQIKNPEITDANPHKYYNVLYKCDLVVYWFTDEDCKKALNRVPYKYQFKRNYPKT